MTDSFARKITYARISLTESCNLNCIYCNPEKICKINENELSDTQIESIIKALLAEGIKKIRFTGGEPLVRKNIIPFLHRVCSLAPINWAITTNGTTLKDHACELKKAGINHINISLDTLDDDEYKDLTGGTLKKVLDGIDKVFSMGFETVRINAVLVKGISEKQIKHLAGLTINNNVDVRFIELMPIGECVEWSKKHFMNASSVLDVLPDLQDAKQDIHAPAKYYKLPDAKGRVGIITPMSCNFCEDCNRIRITADGKIKPCLHSDMEIELKDVLEDEKMLRERIRDAVFVKPERHYLDENKFIKRNMSQIGG